MWCSPLNCFRIFRRWRQRHRCDSKVFSFDLNGYGFLQFPERQICCLAGFSNKTLETLKLLDAAPGALIRVIEAVELSGVAVAEWWVSACHFGLHCSMATVLAQLATACAFSRNVAKSHQTMNLSPNTTQVINPKELRPLVHAQLDSLPDHCLEAAQKLIMDLQLRELVDELGAEMDETWKSGRITQESIAKAIQEHRQKHPYR